jgi:hypothetical protein
MAGDGAPSFMEGREQILSLAFRLDVSRNRRCRGWLWLREYPRLLLWRGVRAFCLHDLSGYLVGRLSQLLVVGDTVPESVFGS